MSASELAAMGLGQTASATRVDLFAFGSRSGPRPPRPGIDYVPDAAGMIGPEQPPFPAGASLFADLAILREKTMTANVSSILWGQLVAEFARGAETPNAWNAVFAEGVDRVGLVREALTKDGGNQRAAAVSVLQRMSGEEQQQLYPELMQLARAAHGPVAVVRKIVASLPREWVLARIDAEVERLVEDEQYDDYWMLIELLAELDHERAVRLARRAAQSADPDIRELGSDMLASLCGK